MRSRQKFYPQLSERTITHTNGMDQSSKSNPLDAMRFAKPGHSFLLFGSEGLKLVSLISAEETSV